MSQEISKREQFSGKLGIIAAAAGSAIGLGNIWRFPYMAGKNGGAAFIILYILCIALIGLPVMLSEFVIGRRAKKNAIASFRRLAPGKPWFIVGWMGIAAAFMILSFYGVVAGWTLEYIFKSLTGSFAGMDPAAIGKEFGDFIGSPVRPVFWQVVFMVLTGGIVYAGIKDGIEKYSKILMPLLLVILVVLDVRAITLAGAGDGLAFLFKPDFSSITAEGFLAALGHAFFSLSLGIGTMITYSSYFDKKQDLATTAVQVTVADTLIALMAGIAIFPAVFAFNIEPSAGPGLVFVTLPNVFLQMPGGWIFSVLFFVLLAVAALTSSISMLEVMVAYFAEDLNISRKKATIASTVVATLVGVPCSLSNGVMADVKIFGKNFFDLLDFTSSSVLMPIGGLMIVLFVCWVLKEDAAKDELSNGGALKVKFFPWFMFAARFIAPVAIALVFLNGLGLLKF